MSSVCPTHGYQPTADGPYCPACDDAQGAVPIQLILNPRRTVASAATAAWLAGYSACSANVDMDGPVPVRDVRHAVNRALYEGQVNDDQRENVVDMIGRLIEHHVGAILAGDPVVRSSFCFGAAREVVKYIESLSNKDLAS